MIFEIPINLLCRLIVGVLETMNLVTLPVNAIQALGAFCAYGSHVVGADLLLIFCSCVLGWAVLKGTFGLLLFIWRLLPFT